MTVTCIDELQTVAAGKRRQRILAQANVHAHRLGNLQASRKAMVASLSLSAEGLEDNHQERQPGDEVETER